MEHFDAVVVGSGFGGSVVAHELAAAGKQVCVLERGQEYRPGSFPRLLQNVRDNFWDPSERLFGLYNVWFFKRLGALVSSGVGGGSLIYANVLMRKDPKWFVAEDFEGGYRPWPVSREQLDPHYDEVARVLQPVTYPRSEAYLVDKVRAFRAAAAPLHGKHGRTLIEPPLAVTFGDAPGAPIDGENMYGFARRTCTLCGECVVGCNTGSKNTLDLTYLSRAKARGAEIRSLHEVRGFTARATHVEIEYVVHPDRDRIRTLTCERLVLAAGAFGSTYLMLKNLPLRHVGTRFSGNGDLLMFSTMSRDRIDATRGPTITSALRQADAFDTNDPQDGPGFYIEDGGFPKELAWMMEGFDLGGWLSRGARFLREGWRKMFGASTDTDLGAELSQLLGGADLSSRTLPLLAMGRDVPDGKLWLSPDGRLQLDWTRARSAEYFDRVEAVARLMVGELGGRYLRYLPTYVFGRAVTTHPVGGCPMGTSEADGVVDSYGQVFAAPRVSIVDGSVMPSAVGANPAFTIAAFAHRAAHRMLD